MKIVRARLALAAAVIPVTLLAGTSTNTAGPVQQGSTTPGDYSTNNPAITISLSGQTALRGFTTSLGITALPAGSQITLKFGPAGTPVTYYSPNVSNANVQLAQRNFGLVNTGVGASSFDNAAATQTHSALRFEWHEQGSGDGLIDLINDEVGYSVGTLGTGILSTVAARGQSSSNPTWINGGSFNTGASQTLNGHFLDGGNYADTYNTTTYDLATGRNKLGGQNRIQFAVGEFKTESFAVPGTASVTAAAGVAGYGQGNPALKSASNFIGLGVTGGRQQLRPDTIVNQSNDKVDPNSTSSSVYSAGPWNTAGANNIDSKQVAVTAVTLSANPGTGLQRVNATDTKWIQTLGRLQNGADFNNVSRTANTGQRIVFALNTGVDPTWAVGENDDGDTSGTASANAQKTIGPNFRFSGKTSGTEARNAIAQSRLGIGALSLAENRGASSAAPVRSLAIDFNDATDPNTSNGSDYSAFIHPTFDTIANFTFKTVLISHYNAIKAANPTLLTNYRSTFQTANGRQPTTAEEQTWWNGLSSDQTGIKGDQFGNVAAVIKNVTDSIGTAAAGITASSVTNPGDALFLNGFLAPGLLDYKRETDGGALTPNTLSPAQQAVRNDVKSNYGFNFATTGAPGSPLQTSGNNAFYGQLNSGNTGTLAINTSVPITEKDASGNTVSNGSFAPRGNYLFGNFNQTGTRDFASAKEAVNAALALRHVDGAKSSIYTSDGGVANNTVVPALVGTPGWSTSANTKGDLIVLGDFNSDGAFDGKDVYLIARGTSLSDAAANSTGLTTASGPNFADQVRNPNARLNKNATLDYAQSQTAPVTGDPGSVNVDRAYLRSTARTVLTGTHAPAGATVLTDFGGGLKTYTNDPTGANAFNKNDVNRDGLVDVQDARIVNAFHLRSFKNLNDQLSAVVRTDSNDSGTAFANGITPLDPSDVANAAIPRRQISLVDVELNDTGTIDINDFAVVRTAIGAQLRDGDANFDGTVDTVDFALLIGGFGKTTPSWSQGNFSLDSVVSSPDFNLLVANYGLSAAGGLPGEFPGALVPDPAAGLGMLGLGLFARRTRRG